MDRHPLISADPAVMTGVPCLKGTRVTVANVLRQIAAGRTIPEICSDYPYLTPDAVRAAVHFAAEIASAEEHELARA